MLLTLPCETVAPSLSRGHFTKSSVVFVGWQKNLVFVGGKSRKSAVNQQTHCKERVVTEGCFTSCFPADNLAFERKCCQVAAWGTGYPLPLWRRFCAHSKHSSELWELWFVPKAWLKALWMTDKEMILCFLSVCVRRWFGLASHAPHAVPEHHPARHEPCPANPAAAAHLLVPWCPPHPLLLPTLSPDGVHGESQPGPSKDDAEQWAVGRWAGSGDGAGWNGSVCQISGAVLWDAT